MVSEMGRGRGKEVTAYWFLKEWGVTKRCRTLSGHNVVEGKDFKSTA